VFCFGGNASTAGLNPGYSERPTFHAYLERVAREYRQLSPTPEQFDAFFSQISVMWDNEPRWSDADLRRISCPFTVAIAAHDEAISQSHAHYMANTIPNAKLDVISGGSHFAMLQQPSLFFLHVNRFLYL
jgi:pimeloyl-ACP methyl ester carboxylesterase